jgi:hypothetical protein
MSALEPEPVPPPLYLEPVAEVSNKLPSRDVSESLAPDDDAEREDDSIADRLAIQPEAFASAMLLPPSSSLARAAEVSSAPDEDRSAATPPTPEMIDAVVARVMERMQPQLMEIVTREVLRPVVEALVRREIEK